MHCEGAAQSADGAESRRAGLGGAERGLRRDGLEALQEAGIRDRVRVMVGGAPVTQEWADSIGADGYAEDVLSAVELAKRLLG